MNKIEVNKKLVAVVFGSTVFVNGSVFAALSAEDKGKTASGFVKTRGVIEFLDNFSRFTDTKKIKVRLLNGEDVTQELEFNGITLDPEFKTTFEAFKKVLDPVVKALDLVGPGVPDYPFAEAKNKPLVVSDCGSYVGNGIHQIGIKVAQEIWCRASKSWAVAGKRLPGSRYESLQGPVWRSEYVYFRKNYIEIGCQTIYRDQVEQLALKMGWPFPSSK